MSTTDAVKASARPGAFLAAAAVSFAAVLYLPYFVPQAPTASDSYLFGYNNRAAIALLLTVCAGLVFFFDLRPLRELAVERAKRIPLKALAYALAVQGIGCGLMIFLVGGLGGFVESNYELDRIDLVSRGLRPYVDFEWPFGPALLYGPRWLERLLHLGAVDAYDLFWTAASLAGVALLYGTVQQLDYPTQRKTSIFSILFAASMLSVVNTGTHYTLLRYAAAPYCILQVFRSGEEGREWVAAAKGAAFMGLLWLVSPEMAIAHGFACLVLTFPKRSGISPIAIGPAAYAAMAAGICGEFAAALRGHLLSTLLRSGGGADSFPVVFSAPALCFFAVVLVCCGAVAQRMREPGHDDNSVALIVLSAPLMAAALGRCDPGHMLWNGLGFFLAALLYASSSERAWRWSRNAFLAGMVLLPSFVVVRYVGQVAVEATADNMARESATGRTGAEAAFARLAIRLRPGREKEAEALRVAAPPERIDFASVYPHAPAGILRDRLDAPLGYKPGRWSTYRSESVDYGRYEALENANTPDAVRQKIQELAAHPNRGLLLPEDAAARCGVREQLERAILMVYFFAPYTAKAVNPGSVHQPLCDYILGHYTLTEPASKQNYDYALWTPKRLPVQ